MANNIKYFCFVKNYAILYKYTFYKNVNSMYCVIPALIIKLAFWCCFIRYTFFKIISSFFRQYSDLIVIAQDVMHLPNFCSIIFIYSDFRTGFLSDITFSCTENVLNVSDFKGSLFTSVLDFFIYLFLLSGTYP